MCPRKDIGSAVGYVSLKPTAVYAELYGSAKGVAHPYPCLADWQRHGRRPSWIWGRHGAGILFNLDKIHAFFRKIYMKFWRRMDTVMAVIFSESLFLWHCSYGIDRVPIGHTSGCTAPKSMFFGELWVSQNSACNGLMTALLFVPQSQ